MATVIDALIVTLGLDPKNFKKGSDEAKRQTKDTQDVVKKSSNDIVENLGNAAAGFAKMFLGITGARDAIRILGDINKAAADLGRTAANTGTSSSKLNAAGNAVELIGGNAADAASAFRLWSESITSLRVDKVLTPLMQLARIRLGIATEDEQGRVREFGDVAEDIADKLAGYSRADAHNILEKAGFQEGYINYLLLEKSVRADIRAQAEAQNKLNNDATKAAAELQSQWAGVKQTIKGAEQEIQTGLIPIEKDAMTLLKGGLDIVINAFKVAMNSIKSIFAGIGEIPFVKKFLAFNDKTIKARDNFFSELITSLKNAAGANDEKKPDTGSPTSDNRNTVRQGEIDTNNIDVRNHNPGNLRAYKPGQAVDSRGIRTFGNNAEGVQALRDDISAKLARGLDTFTKIISVYAPARDNNNVPAYIEALVKSTGKGANEKLTPADRDAIVRGIIDHEGAAPRGTSSLLLNGNPGALAAARGVDVQQNANAAAGSVSNSRSNTNSVRIDNLNVSTQASDPNGIAAALPAAIQRKGLIAQADTGQS